MMVSVILYDVCDVIKLLTGAGNDTLVSAKKKRKTEDVASSKGKGRKVDQDQPSLKRKRLIDDEVEDDNAMQTRMRTGTISKVNN